MDVILLAHQFSSRPGLFRFEGATQFLSAGEFHFVVTRDYCPRGCLDSNATLYGGRAILGFFADPSGDPLDPIIAGRTNQR